MERKTDAFFQYPPNLHELDLATLVSMYRSRGEPQQATPGNYFACAWTHRLIKNAKWWFGLYYSQPAWDQLLTKGSEGFPLTEVELNILGLAYAKSEEQPPHRDFVEKNCGVIPKLGYMIVNDLKQFGFLNEDENGRLRITPRGEKGLQGISRRVYEKKFTPEMLLINQQRSVDPVPEGKKKPESEQTTLF